MADTIIAGYLKKIIEGVYGKDVRQSIHDAIQQCYTDASAGITPIITTEAVETGTKVTVTVGASDTSFIVYNGTATTEEVETYVNAWLDAHPEVATTITDGAVTASKLATDVIDEVEIPIYEAELVLDLNGKDGLLRGSFVDNIPVENETGKVYFTPYLAIADFYADEDSLSFCGSTSFFVRYYDANKNYIRGGWSGKPCEPNSSFTQGEIYLVVEGNLGKTTKNGVYRNKKTTVSKMQLPSNEYDTCDIVEKTIKFTCDADGICDVDTIPVLPNEVYTFASTNYACFEVCNASGKVLTNLIDVSSSGTCTTTEGVIGATYIKFRSANANTTGTITGKFPVMRKTSPELKLVENNFTPELYQIMRKNMGSNVGDSGVYYNCQDYGVIPASEDNTEAFQALVDLVHENGGGVIWIPVGTYIFHKDSATECMNRNAWNNVYLKSNVSILGESITASVIKLIGETQTGCSMFGAFGGEEDTLVGCTISNFTVDLSEQTMAIYTHRAKAFFMHGVKDCVFRDLRLISTPSTSMGIDMLDNVVLDSIYVYQGGRQWSYGGGGGAGIGIGTGLWENENYIIRNCVCDSCGHYGIFLEDQGLFNGYVSNYPKGQIIANNIIRNGRHYGIGVRGGKNILVTGNNLYENVGGLYTDYGAKNVLYSNNLVQGSTKNAFEYGDEYDGYACQNIVVTGNTFIENGVGIKKTLAPTNSVEQNNVFIGNTVDEE